MILKRLLFCLMTYFLLCLIPGCNLFNNDSNWSAYDNVINLTMKDSDELAYAIGQTTTDSKGKISMYVDLPGVKDVFVGIYNTSSKGDNFFIKDVEKIRNAGLLTKTSPFFSNRMEFIARENRQNMEKVANRQLRSLGNVMGKSLLSYDADIVDSTTFTFNAPPDRHNATLRYKSKVNTAFGDKTLKIWVENSSWKDGGSEAYITQNMVIQLAEKFLKNGLNNDIYDWVTHVFGEEWYPENSTSIKTGLIPPSDEINILLADLDNDDREDGGTLGFFWSKDNYLQDSSSSSNEKIMFYIDSLIFSQDEGEDGWNIDDYFPSVIVSTLGHELQHMIAYYQSSVVRGLIVETYVQEMLSLATEDFLAQKLGIPGPRGYITDDGSAGMTQDNNRGRIPLFNTYMDTPRNMWLSYSSDSDGVPYVLRSYAYFYAYGAYITRNFGGPAILQKIMYEGENNNDILSFLTESESRHVSQFQMAILLSDKMNMEKGLQFNNGGWFRYNFNGVDYSLPSINFYNYLPKPYVFSQSDMSDSFNLSGKTMYTIKIPNLSGQTRIRLNTENNQTLITLFLLAR